MRERSLLFIKPDGVIRRYVGARLLADLATTPGVEIDGLFVCKPTVALLESHYAQHKGKFFYNWLIEYTSCHDLLVAIVNGDGIVSHLRAILGNTMPEHANCTTIRSRYGLGYGINVAHASDSAENATREINLWMPYLAKSSEKTDWRRYVDRYINFPMIDTRRYREITEQFISSRLCEEDLREDLLHLLRQETDLDDGPVLRLIDVIMSTLNMRKSGDE